MNKIIKGLNLYVNGKEASEEELNSLNNFICHLKSSRKVCFIYRGENNLSNHYNTSLGNISLLSQEIFLLGEKGRSFFGSPKLYDNVFQFLWDKFNGKVCELKFENSNTLEQVSTFLKENPSIKNYWVTCKNVWIRQKSWTV